MRYTCEVGEIGVAVVDLEPYEAAGLRLLIEYIGTDVRLRHVGRQAIQTACSSGLYGER
jgi:hypothetical protein